jgi:hypothetical protein
MNTGADGQDWTPVQLVRGGARGGAGRPHVPDAVVAAAKLDAAEDPAKPKYFTMDSVKDIQNYRRENGLTQVQLDGRCSFPTGTINKLEGRNRTPTSKELQTLNNLLRLRLVLG